MEREQLLHLLRCICEDTATDGQKAAFYAFVSNPENRHQFEAAMAEDLMYSEATAHPPVDETGIAGIAGRVLQIDNPRNFHVNPVVAVTTKRAWMPMLRRVAVAALVLVLFGAGYWHFYATEPIAGHGRPTRNDSIFMPGRSGAVLTLADGKKIILDEQPAGRLTSEAGVDVYLQDGSISYNARNAEGETPVSNEIATPRGRQFGLVLPDGSRAWLNAASRIRYPTRFADNDREVEIEGEVFFAVTKSKDRPFRVRVKNGVQIEVLGTSFNIHAYDNEATIQTTLVEGSVALSAEGAGTVKLLPGMQASLATNTGKPRGFITAKADMEKATAWKNGYFNFEGASLEEVMRQIERWYDVDVVFKGKAPTAKFAGEMERNIPLNDLLAMFREMGITCRLENGRTLAVFP